MTFLHEIIIRKYTCRRIERNVAFPKAVNGFNLHPYLSLVTGQVTLKQTVQSILQICSFALFLSWHGSKMVYSE
jgi:hypothetical protein